MTELPETRPQTGPAVRTRRGLRDLAPQPIVDLARTVTQLGVSRRTRRLYREFVSPGQLVFDVGAHTGARTAVFLSLGARVVAVEPQAACVATLRSRFGDEPRVEIVPMAIAEAEREAQLYVCTRATTITTMSSDWMTGRFADHEWDEVQTVQTTTLDALIARSGAPSFCKIDVEGLEYDVLRGLSAPLPAVSIEFVGERPDATERCLNRLTDIGFTRFTYSLGESGRLELPASPGTSASALRARLAALDDPLAWGDIYALA